MTIVQNNIFNSNRECYFEREKKKKKKKNIRMCCNNNNINI